MKSEPRFGSFCASLIQTISIYFYTGQTSLGRPKWVAKLYSTNMSVHKMSPYDIYCNYQNICTSMNAKIKNTPCSGLASIHGQSIREMIYLDGYSAFIIFLISIVPQGNCTAQHAKCTKMGRNLTGRYPHSMSMQPVEYTLLPGVYVCRNCQYSMCSILSYAHPKKCPHQA